MHSVFTGRADLITLSKEIKLLRSFASDCMSAHVSAGDCEESKIFVLGRHVCFTAPENGFCKVT